MPWQDLQNHLALLRNLDLEGQIRDHHRCQVDITSRCFSTLEIFVHGQRKRGRIAQSLQYLHTDLTPFKICMECLNEVPICIYIKKITICFGNVNLSHHLTSFSWLIINLPFTLNKKQCVNQSIHQRCF